jgi:hypothetical protein
MFNNQIDMAQNNPSFQYNIIKIMNTPLPGLPTTTTKKKSGDYNNGQKSQYVAFFYSISFTHNSNQINCLITKYQQSY